MFSERYVHACDERGFRLIRTGTWAGPREEAPIGFEQERPVSRVSVAHAGGVQTGTGGGARGRGRQGRRSGGRHDNGRGRHQQGHLRQTLHGHSTSHPRRCRNSRTHGSSSSNSSTSRNFHSHNSKDRTTTSLTPGAAGEDHPTSSGEEERNTSVDHDIEEEIRLTSSA